MKNIHCKYYRVFENSPAIQEISVIDLKPALKVRFNNGMPTKMAKGNNRIINKYSLLPLKDRFYEYTDKINAMEKAKKNALRYINALTTQITIGINSLKKYREEYYTELNLTLIDSNIRKLEREMNIK
ncbi:hypothetical protein IM792_02710 [Mucilaginibacter sp. JRF]|uniref:hypothetical protein n=1 Tax=Mucilaginibacter sp. JRF TaxID=2780088 RepID=UPI0018821E25|nr:hypothetical protein [Mucilaginibacter sp. JRF]MBE9583348.1 hypothetical protein [Mucilaginibacter sp. JRF]